MRQQPAASWISTSPTHAVPLEQAIDRLSRHGAVEGILIIGSAVESSMTPASDYDLVLVLSDMPVPLGVALTTIDGRLADLIFVTARQIDEVLALDAPVDGDQWIGRIVRWLLAGQIAYDRSGAIARAQAKVQGGDWLLAKTLLDGYGAWFRINFNLAHTRRLFVSPDPTYQAAAELRTALYGHSDLLFGYWEIRALSWEGDKAAIRYLTAHDPDYLALFQRFMREPDPRDKFALYEQLAARTIAPLGPLWPKDLLTFTIDGPIESQAVIETGRHFCHSLLAE